MYTSIYSGPNFYVYLITDLNPIGTEKYYIGSSYRKELQENNINPEEDTYYGSSSVEHFKILQKTQSSQLERVIIETFDNIKECLDYEENLQREHKAAINPLFYNKGYANKGFAPSFNSNAKHIETITDPEWKATTGKKQSAKMINTRNDPEWKATTGKDSTAKHIETITDPEWKATIGKDKIRKHVETRHGYKFYGFKGVGEFHSAQALVNAIKEIHTYSVLARTIRRLCKQDFNAVISKGSINRSLFLQNLPNNPINKTWKSLGFYYYEIAN